MGLSAELEKGSVLSVENEKELDENSNMQILHNTISKFRAGYYESLCKNYVINRVEEISKLCGLTYNNLYFKEVLVR
mgnify:CR=1 FL=1